MSPFIKTLGLVAIGAMVALILFAVVGHFLDTHGVIRNRPAAATVAKLTAVGLFLVLGFSLAPLMMHGFIVAQGAIGNADQAWVRFVREHERGVIFTMWGIFTVGLVIALPVMWTALFNGKVRLDRSPGG